MRRQGSRRWRCAPGPRGRTGPCGRGAPPPPRRRGPSTMRRTDGSASLRGVLRRLPLPPGCAVLCLDRASEQPRVFGQLRAPGGAATSGFGEGGESDGLAEWVATDAVDQWGAPWPFAAACGVGASLDFCAGRSYVCVLLVGFEGAEPPRRERAAPRGAAFRPPAAGQHRFGATVRTLQ
ncbi:unnamed protein product, partial [Prorocentrum cordatum]